MYACLYAQVHVCVSVCVNVYSISQTRGGDWAAGEGLICPHRRGNARERERDTYVVLLLLSNLYNIMIMLLSMKPIGSDRIESNPPLRGALIADQWLVALID
eukprot:GHVU01029675.1.p2 GENE.GHVU01029675.1~~GHVU01029675.1.p2  ORF type:complete len:102 (+),score=6.44 GHVU01029675.1:73-378(+)